MYIEQTFHPLYGTRTLATQFCHVPNGISLAKQIYYFPIFGLHLFFRFYRASLSSEFEKVFLPCEEYQKREPRTYRMSLHFYDLEKLSHTDYMDMVLSDSNLYYDIVEHRKRFYHVGHVDYATIIIVPREDISPVINTQLF